MKILPKEMSNIKKYPNKSLISSIALVSSIIILVILVSVTIFVSKNSIYESQIKSFNREISQIQSKVDTYFNNHKKLPIIKGSTRTVSTSTILDLTQFAKENIQTGPITLYEIDLNAMGVLKVVRGLKKNNDINDIYVVSTKTNQVYYLKGQEIESKTYYMATADLSPVQYSQTEIPIKTANQTFYNHGVIVEQNIVNWTNQKIITYIYIPDNSSITSIKMTASDGLTVTGPTKTKEDYKKYSVSKLGNYSVNMSYSKGGQTVFLKHDVSNFDNTDPTIDTTSNPSVDFINSVDNTITSYQLLNFLDNQSGIKTMKYSNIKISDPAHANSYFMNYGKELINNIIHFNPLDSVYTVYVEDNAGNYHSTVITHVPKVPFRYFELKEAVNAPQIPFPSNNISAVTFDVATGKWKVVNTPSKNDWYGYTTKEKKWANIRLADGVGANGSLYTWIPRFAYKIIDKYHQTTDYPIFGRIEVKFLVDTTMTAADGSTVNLFPTYGDTDGVNGNDNQTNYILHPAFRFDKNNDGVIQKEEELAGFWLSKFETSPVEGVGNMSSGSNSDDVTTKTVQIIPGVPSWRNIHIGNAFAVCRLMETNKRYGWRTDTSNNNLDVHLMKGIEWGALTYLTHSSYGRNGELLTNNSSETFITGGGTENFYINTPSQSSTGNPYGIYDMAGGAFEFEAGYLNNGTANLRTNGNSSAAPYNKVFTGTSPNIVLANAYKPYWDFYPRGSTDTVENNYAKQANVKGNSIYEISSAGTGNASWANETIEFPRTSTSFMSRSTPNDMNCDIFRFDCRNGSAESNIGFRPIIICQEGF